MMNCESLNVLPRINPELKQHSELFGKRVYRVGENVYCAVGWGPANTIMVEGDDGIILLDVGRELESGLDVKNEFEKITQKPIKTVIYTHFHPDHIHGVRAFISDDDVRSGRVEIIAQEHLMENLMGQSLTLGPILSTRTRYTFGAYLRGEDAKDMSIGIGPRTKVGTFTFIPPTRTFKDELHLTVAGVEMVLYHVPSEAPDEVAVLLPESGILFSSEVEQGPTLPNIYPLRGAKFRDPVQWVRSLDFLRSLKAEAMVPHHGLPVEGAARVEEVLRMTRDGIQFVHDQTIRHMNRGLTPDELAETVVFPPHLADYSPYLREFYGTVKQSVREIYQGYLGWFEGDPVALDPIPPKEKAERLIKLMGGYEKVLEETLRAYKRQEYQWAAELATYLICVDGQNLNVRKVKAAAFRNLAYGQININWRNWYLTAAMELDGSLDVEKAHLLPGQNFASPDVVRSMPARFVIQGLCTRLKAEETFQIEMTLGFNFRETNESYALEIRRGVAQFHNAVPEGDFPVLNMDKGYFSKKPLNLEMLQSGKASGKVLCRGSWNEAERFLGYFDFEPHPIRLTTR